MFQFNPRVAIEIGNGSIQGKTDSLIAKRIENLRIKFTVKSNLLKGSNTAEIDIFNLSEKTRNAIRGQSQSGRQGDQITIFAGYDDATKLQVVFSGFCVEVGHMKEPPDVRTHIQANSENAESIAKRASFTFAEGTLGSQVLDSVAKSLGMAVENFAKYVDGPYINGFAFTGKARTALDDVTKRLGLKWFQQNGKIKIINAGGNTGRRRVLLSSDSGLIGSPERLWRTLDEPDTEKKPPGWKFKCLLRPEIVVGDLVGIQSREINPARAYAVQSLQHEVDNYLGPNTTTGEVIEPGVLVE